LNQNEVGNQYKLTYKSELLAAMTKCTEKFLNSKDIDAIFADVLIIMGKARNHIVPITMNTILY
jgi:hypothetical protein